MGIFDKRAKQPKVTEDFDSPVETVDLRTQQTEASGSVNTPPPLPAAPAEPEREYGIEEAIALMRTLPKENAELVVRVMKTTLESTNVDIKKIIAAAQAKDKDIRESITALEAEIVSLKKQAEIRAIEIESLKADREETASVRKRLQSAAKSDNPSKTDSKKAKSSKEPPKGAGSAQGISKAERD